MDDCDRADSRIENVIEDGLKEARRAHPSLVACGFCHYCGEFVLPGRLFCDTKDNDCRDDWHFEQSRKKANGTA